MEFESADPSVVKSIRQRVLLNAWLRALRKPKLFPIIGDFQPDGVADELPDMMGFDVAGEGDNARFWSGPLSTAISCRAGQTGKCPTT